jgi:hypothetical protein
VDGGPGDVAVVGADVDVLVGTPPPVGLVAFVDVSWPPAGTTVDDVVAVDGPAVGAGTASLGGVAGGVVVGVTATVAGGVTGVTGGQMAR